MTNDPSKTPLGDLILADLDANGPAAAATIAKRLNRRVATDIADRLNRLVRSGHVVVDLDTQIARLA